MPEPTGLASSGATFDLSQNQGTQSKRPRPPHPDSGGGEKEKDRVPLRPQPDKLNRRESRLGLRNLFGRNKPTTTDLVIPTAPAPAPSPREIAQRPGGIRASLAGISNWPYGFHSGSSQSRKSESVLPSLTSPSGDNAQTKSPPRAAPDLKHKKSASVVRSSRGSIATWEPPPLFQAYPQAIKHAHLPACTASAEAVLRLHHSKGSLSLRGSLNHSLLSLGTADDGGGEKGDKSKKRHKRNNSTSSLKLEWTTKIFVLVTSGYLLQYSGEGPFNRLPEKVLELGKDSAAFASDVIPGRHWVLQVSSAADSEGVTSSVGSPLFSRLTFRAIDRKQTGDFLMVFESADEMDGWIATLRREIEALGGKKNLSETGKPKVDEPDEQNLRNQASQRTLVVRDPDRFSRLLSPDSWDPPTMSSPDIHLHLADSRSVREQSFDGTSTASLISHDGRQLDGLRDSTHRLSYMSSGQRTMVTSAGSSPACSPLRDSFASQNEDFRVPDLPPLDEEPQPRLRPNAAAINDRRQSLQTINHLVELRVASAQNSRPQSICMGSWNTDPAAGATANQTIPNFSVPQGASKRYCFTRPTGPTTSLEQPQVPSPQTPVRSALRRPPPTAISINSRPLSFVEDQPSPLSPCSNQHDWADDEDLDETTVELPPPQRIANKDGSTTIIEYRFNDQGQKVKTTRRIRLITHREVVNPRVAERKGWSKFGLSAKDNAGPMPDTTSVGENIIFKPSINWRKDAKNEDKDPNAQAMKDKLKDKKVKCRICNGEHFTARCPYKDTMAPIGEAGAAGDVAAGMGDEAAGEAASVGAAGAGKKGSYVPPALRGNRAGGGEGERMGGKYGERDDLATLRVTNVSEMAEEGELRDMFERFGRVTRVFLAKDRETGMAKGFAFISFADRSDAVKACQKMDGWGFKHLILRVEFAKKTA
ncbi:eukaryotic translation initiation factor 3 subunit G-domain-containing protein [Rhypophila decipiens]|uniref:Eukaryotic translation initiation factor 3 subunit G n=1 Tax=Rhypophila decipiens TaxID=261697 RepID=A0AAN6YAF4_9PEZI|nr:eukaryotic translation initiation factor 3 subunit G-domain-containing protein [Rhypophila decipiens]